MNNINIDNIENVELCVLNITSWVNNSLDAIHYYGSFNLIFDKSINIDNIDNRAWGFYVKNKIELKRILSKKEAEILDEKDQTAGIHLNLWKENKCKTIRFNTVKQLTNTAIKVYKKYNFKCPFISLYNRKKFNETIILYKKDIV
jgi:hypothetical protein